MNLLLDIYDTLNNRCRSQDWTQEMLTIISLYIAYKTTFFLKKNYKSVHNFRTIFYDQPLQRYDDLNKSALIFHKNFPGDIFGPIR